VLVFAFSSQTSMRNFESASRRCIWQKISITLCLQLIGLISFVQAQSFDLGGAAPLGKLDESNSGQTSTASAADPLKMNVNLVLVPVRVTDTKNRPVTTLDKGDFALYEDDQQQKIEYFSSEDAPLTVGLLLDLSKSMTDKFDAERGAVSEFFKNANRQDDYFVITFANRPKLVTEATQSLSTIQSGLALATPDGNTALLDAISLGMNRMRSAQYRRRALVIISDGGDNHSRHRLKEIKRLVQDSDVDVYAIGLFDAGLFKTFEESMGRRWLNELTEITGGHTIPVNDISKLPEAAAAISREIRDEYVLGYRPRNFPVDHTRRKIKVQVVSSTELAPMHATYRAGYLASDK